MDVYDDRNYDEHRMYTQQHIVKCMQPGKRDEKWDQKNRDTEYVNEKMMSKKNEQSRTKYALNPIQSKRE